jgi:hypothetical protein
MKKVFYFLFGFLSLGICHAQTINDLAGNYIVDSAYKDKVLVYARSSNSGFSNIRPVVYKDSTDEFPRGFQKEELIYNRMFSIFPDSAYLISYDIDTARGEILEMGHLKLFLYADSNTRCYAVISPQRGKIRIVQDRKVFYVLPEGVGKNGYMSFNDIFYEYYVVGGKMKLRSVSTDNIIYIKE